MLFPKRNDSVFQLSLTELAFTLVFLLLLLSGIKLMVSDRDKNEAEKKVEKIQARINKCDAENAKKNSCDEINQILKQQGNINPDELISAMQRADKMEKENQDIKKKIEDLDAQLTTMQAIKDVINKSDNTSSDINKYLQSAAKFKAAYEKFSGEVVREGDEGNKAKSLAMNSDSGDKLIKSEKNLAYCNGNLTYCTEKFIKSGYGLPPCWTDKAGKQIHYLFEVEIRTDGLRVTKAWPQERDEDAAQLPNIGLLTPAHAQSLATFKENARGIFLESKQSTPIHPECRHYVIMKRSADLTDINGFNRLRLGVEDYFYKLDKTQSH